MHSSPPPQAAGRGCPSLPALWCSQRTLSPLPGTCLVGDEMAAEAGLLLRESLEPNGLWLLLRQNKSVRHRFYRKPRGRPRQILAQALADGSRRELPCRDPPTVAVARACQRPLPAGHRWPWADTHGTPGLAVETLLGFPGDGGFGQLCAQLPSVPALKAVGRQVPGCGQRRARASLGAHRPCFDLI